MKEKALQRFFSFRRFMIYSKVWAQRTMSWISVANSGMILFLVLARLQEYGINISVTHWFVPLFLVMLLMLILLGYIEDKAGFHREELHEVAKKNPLLNDIIKRLDRIEKKMDRK